MILVAYNHQLPAAGLCGPFDSILKQRFIAVQLQKLLRIQGPGERPQPGSRAASKYDGEIIVRKLSHVERSEK